MIELNIKREWTKYLIKRENDYFYDLWNNKIILPKRNSWEEEEKDIYQIAAPISYFHREILFSGFYINSFAKQKRNKRAVTLGHGK